MKFEVASRRQRGACDFESGHTRIDEVKFTDSARHHRGPSAASATDVRATCIGWQPMPREDREICVECALAFVAIDFGLRKIAPLFAKSGGGFWIRIDQMISG